MDVPEPANCGLFFRFNIQRNPTKFLGIWGHMGAYMGAYGPTQTGDAPNCPLRIPAHVQPIQEPLLYAVPLQLLAYHAAVLKGTDIDQPRNLAKSVTVE